MKEREAAYLITYSVLEEGAYLNKKADEIIRKNSFDKKEEAFIRRLSYGTVEKKIYLDTIIDAYSKTPVKKLKKNVKNILRLGVYQIKFMEGIKDHAKIYETVSLSEKFKASYYKGFINGVLRSILRNEKEVSFDSLEKRYSIPDEIVSILTEDRGKEDAKKILKGLSEEKRICISVNKNKTDPDKLKEKLLSAENEVYETGEENALFLVPKNGIEALPGFHSGEFYIQDISTIKAINNADVTPGEKILDTCAAPGGKTFLLSLKTGDEGMVYSFDKDKEKTDILRDNIKRLSLKNVYTEERDACEYSGEFKEKFDLVVCDLPCSGLGIIKRKPDIKYRIKRKDIISLSSLQKKMIDVSAAYVKKGGRLLYSTCTLTRKENEENRDYILNKGLSLLKEELTFPDKDRDGFYYCLFKK